MSILSSILKGIASLADIGSLASAPQSPRAPEPVAEPPSRPLEPEPSRPLEPEPSRPLEPEPEPAPQPTSGQIYYQHMHTKIVSDDELRDQIRDMLRSECNRKNSRIVLDDEDRADPLAALERVLLEDGAERSFLLSNCSTGGKRSCWMSDREQCPLADRDECYLERLPCHAVFIRPKKEALRHSCGCD